MEEGELWKNTTMMKYNISVQEKMQVRIRNAQMFSENVLIYDEVAITLCK